jgi:hypothetical protein
MSLNAIATPAGAGALSDSLAKPDGGECGLDRFGGAQVDPSLLGVVATSSIVRFSRRMRTLQGLSGGSASKLPIASCPPHASRSCLRGSPTPRCAAGVGDRDIGVRGQLGAVPRDEHMMPVTAIPSNAPAPILSRPTHSERGVCPNRPADIGAISVDHNAHRATAKEADIMRQDRRRSPPGWRRRSCSCGHS